MKIFNRNGKVNFVDENNVLVGFNSEASCCETFGYHIGKTVPTYRMIVDFECPPQEDANGFNFDVSFSDTVPVSDGDGGAMAVFRLTKGPEELFLTLFNFHNGYYSHGFNMDKDGITLHSGSI